MGAYGDGGLVTTENSKIYKRLLVLRNLGSVKKNQHKYEGLNSRLDTIQASVLLEKLKYTPINNNLRRRISEYYDRKLTNIRQIKLTFTDPGSSRHLYVIRVKNRNKLAKYLIKNKIPIQYHYPYCLNKSEALSKKIKNVKLKFSEKWSKECISLPLHPFMSYKDVNRTVNLIKGYFDY